ncbi:trimeric intracellular cation channel family protein [Arcanobacterium sp. S3PF19]|uniref:trimeric intracellular cation channel family protein n=1 Tax=Arcanobacterium sp. S3PF19 TaxID=1219585 RepID=UPI0009FD8570|nr:TRIC cation channel family protein [Arcanobacterium sp. S3PF19]
MDPETLFRIVDVTGVICNGLIGGTLARSRGFDLIGFLVLGAASALGGGLLRDMMLGIGFPVALTDPWYLGGAFAAAAFSYFVPLDRNKWTHRAMIFGDILAIGCWSATGASKGLSAGLGVVPAIFLGAVTAVCGGMVRDVMVNEIPKIFGGGPLYATFSVFSAAQMVVFQSYGKYEMGMGSSIISCCILIVLARKYGWVLPKPYDLTEYAFRLRQRKANRMKRRRTFGKFRAGGGRNRSRAVIPSKNQDTAN